MKPSSSIQLEIFTHLTLMQNPVQIGCPPNHHSCLLILRALHCHSIENFMEQKSHEKQQYLDNLQREVEKLPEKKERCLDLGSHMHLGP